MAEILAAGSVKPYVDKRRTQPIEYIPTDAEKVTQDSSLVRCFKPVLDIVETINNILSHMN